MADWDVRVVTKGFECFQTDQFGSIEFLKQIGLHQFRLISSKKSKIQKSPKIT